MVALLLDFPPLGDVVFVGASLACAEINKRGIESDIFYSLTSFFLENMSRNRKFLIFGRSDINHFITALELLWIFYFYCETDGVVYIII